MGVGHAGHNGAAALVDHDCTCRRGETVVDAADSAVVDDHRRSAAFGLRRIDDQMSRLNRIGFRVGRGGCDQRGRAGEQVLEHEGPLLPEGREA